jgi:undecaprenyl-diphosphatase
VLTGAAFIALLACRQPSLAAFVLISVNGRLLGPVLKDAIGRDRPASDIVDVHSVRTDLAFPSGHALGATLLYGFLIYAIGQAVPNARLRVPLQAACGAMIALMAYARVELGEHWPTDVLGGCLLGAMVVLPLAAAHSRLWARRRVGA